MDQSQRSKSSVAQQIAQTAIAFHERLTEHRPTSVTVVLSSDTLVIMLHGALSPADQALTTNPHGAVQVQKLHRQLFSNSSEQLRQVIRNITGVDVKEVFSEVELLTGAVVQVFTTGSMVQVFQLPNSVPVDTWSSMHWWEPDEVRSFQLISD